MHQSRSRTALMILAGGSLSLSPFSGLAAAQPSETQANTPMTVFIEPQIDVTTHNAALLYYRVWLNLDSKLQDHFQSGPPMTLADGGAEPLLAAQPNIRALLKATRQTTVDWGVEHELGPYSLLPHFAKARGSTRILAADTLRVAEDGDSSAAADRLIGLQRLAEHVSKDTYLIGSLVGLAISNLGNTLTTQLLDAGQLVPSDAERILAVVGEIDAAHPLHIREAIAQERDGMSEYFLTHCTGPDAGKQFMQHMPGMLGQFDADTLKPIASMSGADLRQDLQGFRRYHDEVLAVWGEENAAAAIGEIETQVERREFGEVAFIFAASISRARQNFAAYEIDHATLVNRLREIAAP